MNKLVSIIIPVFNTGEYLDETMRSVVSQTYEDIEILLVDDGSTDESGFLCDKWSLSDSRIHVFHIENSGPSLARNYVIDRSNGEYILPVDSDDCIAEDYVEKAVRILDNNPHIGIVYCRADLFGDESGEWVLPEYSIQEMLIRNCIFVSAMFRKIDFDLVGGFWGGMKAGYEDYDLWLSIIQLGRSVYRIPEILFHYRKRINSRTYMFIQRESIREYDALRFKRHANLYKHFYETLDEKRGIVLYGAGGAGITYRDFKQSSCSDNIVLWVDRNNEMICRNNPCFPVRNPDSIWEVNSDAIVIANSSIKTTREIKEFLVSKGYDATKIYWYFKGTCEI